MAISITPLSGGNTPADGSDPRTFPAIWNATATQLEGVATDLDTLEATVGDYDLNALNGVGITTPVQGDVLTYNGTSWVNGNPAGSILQVVSTTKTDVFTTSSATYADVTGLNVSITPSSSSNKVWVTGHIAINTPLAGGVAFFQIVRDSTPICIGDAAGSRARATGFRVGSSSNTFVGGTGMFTFNFLDNPSTTSSTNYKIQVTAGGVALIGVNRTGDDGDSLNRARTTSTITAVEVAG